METSVTGVLGNDIGHPHIDGVKIAKALYEFAVERTDKDAVLSAAIHLLIWGSIAERMPNRVFLHYLKLLAMTEAELFAEEHLQAIRKAELIKVENILRYPPGSVRRHQHSELDIEMRGV